jgi:hypothetical protein
MTIEKGLGGNRTWARTSKTGTLGGVTALCHAASSVSVIPYTFVSCG